MYTPIMLLVCLQGYGEIYQLANSKIFGKTQTYPRQAVRISSTAIHRGSLIKSGMPHFLINFYLTVSLPNCVPGLVAFFPTGAYLSWWTAIRLTSIQSMLVYLRALYWRQPCFFFILMTCFLLLQTPFTATLTIVPSTLISNPPNHFQCWSWTTSVGLCTCLFQEIFK